MTDIDPNELTGEEAWPAVPSTPDADRIAEECDGDRASLTPHETAECAGRDLVVEYDNEEDGGS